MRARRQLGLAIGASAALLLAACDGERAAVTAPDTASAARGAALIRVYGCGACHRIPGVRGAVGVVGPPLEAIARRAYLGGVVPNDYAAMVRWLTDPQAVDPLSAMPDVGLDATDAADVAAYLYTLR